MKFKRLKKKQIIKINHSLNTSTPKKPVRDIEDHSCRLSDSSHILGSWWNQHNIDQTNTRRKGNLELDSEAHVPASALSRDER